VLLDLPVTIVDDLERQRANEVGQLLGAVAGNGLSLGHAVRCTAPWLASDHWRQDGARRLDGNIDVRELP
jgi:hypothetical protein